MMAGVAWLIAANVAVLLGAQALLGRFRTGKSSLDLLLFLLFRITLISGIVLATGMIGHLRSLPLGLGGLISSAILLLLGIRLRPGARTFIATFGWGLTLVMVIVSARLLAQVWFFSPHLGDAVNYYLPKVAEWVQSGVFTREMGIHPHVTLPAGFELVATWWVVFLHHDVLIEMAGVEFLLLGGVATYVMARNLGLRERSACGAALLYVMTPGIHLSATSGINDVAAAAMILTTLAIVLEQVPSGLALLAFALGIGIKPTVGYAVPGIALLYAWTRKGRPFPQGSPVAARWAGGMGLVIGGYWYVRNLIWYGNPFYPVGSSQKALFPPPQFGPKVASFLGNFHDLINVKIYDRHAYGALVDDSTGWGIVAFGCGLAALLSWAREDSRARRLAWAFGLSLMSELLLIIHDAWCLKYVFFFPAILAIAVARECEQSRHLIPLVAIGFLIQFLSTMLPYDLPLKSVSGLVGESWRDRSVLEDESGIRTNEPIGFFGGIEGRAYLFYRPDFSRRLVYFRSTSATALKEEMAQSGVQVLFSVPATEEQHAILTVVIQSGFLKPIGGSFYRKE
ncbi:MAG TPA: hypothetical protein VEN81_07775 [Planctomycetota bacterium]|nr:hypothetical protein [Planctomycetota bacterium]